MIKLTIPVAPVAKGRPRLGRNGHVYTPQKTRTFEEEVADHARALAPAKPFQTPVRLTAHFIVPKPKRPKWKVPAGRPDLDNFLKGVTDALNGILWTDDGLITEVHAWKLYDLTGGVPRIELEVEVL